MISIIIIISLIFDGILTNFLPFSVDNLSLFTPLLTLVSLFFIYIFYFHKEKKYYIIVFITGIIYDLLYTNLLFFNGFMFLFICFIMIKLYNYFDIDYFKVLIYVCLIIIFYEIFSCFIFLLFNLIPITIFKVIYKISHSLILNIIYGEILFVIIKFIPSKYKKISIN